MCPYQQILTTQIKLPEIFTEDNDREDDSKLRAENLHISELSQTKEELEKYRALYLFEKDRADALMKKIRTKLQFVTPDGMEKITSEALFWINK